MGVFEITPGGMYLREIAPDTTVEKIHEVTEAEFVVDENLKIMED